MPVTQTEVLSRADFDEAVVKLRANVSEIAKETGIPRTYLSEFRHGDRKLRPELPPCSRGITGAEQRLPEPAPGGQQRASRSPASPPPSWRTGGRLRFQSRWRLRLQPWVLPPPR